MKKQHFSFTSETSRLGEVRGHIRDFLAACHFGEEAVELCVLAVDEACTNIIRYAYRHECQPVELDLERLPDRVRIVLRDYGTPCDPAKIKSRALEDIRPGGLGVHIIKQVFDLVRYEPLPDGTRLVLEKAIKRTAGAD